MNSVLNILYGPVMYILGVVSTVILFWLHKPVNHKGYDPNNRGYQPENAPFRPQPPHRTCRKESKDVGRSSLHSTINKQGHNDAPATPKPDIKPPPQKPARTQIRHKENCDE